MRWFRWSAPTIIVAGMLVGGCSSQTLPQRDDGITDVVATTPIIADLARNVAGERARVTSLMPSGADPHTYEPTLRDVRNIANADLALTNYMLLEEHSLIRAVETNVRPGVNVVTLAEDAAQYGAHLIPLVEDVSLDTIWLGMRVAGKGEHLGATKVSEVRLSATEVRGPGEASAFLTSTFGEPEIYFNSADGFAPSRGYEGDTVSLPVDAHTHVSWAFSEPGVYEIDFAASLARTRGDQPIPLGTTTVTFAVGVDPSQVGARTVLDRGHEDITVDLDHERITIQGDSIDPRSGTPASTSTVYEPASTVISVPNRALQQIPPGPAYRFLGTPGGETYMLAQAVLGKHVHGEIDPHVWHDVANAMAYVKLIRDSLIAVDPEGASEYARNADKYLETLATLDDYMQRAVDSIPSARRQLVTTHDGYAYLADAYGLNIAGFVSPNPAVEPSARDLIALTRTLQNLDVNAVFLEPNLTNRSSDLTQMAARAGIDVCRIYGDSFDEEVTTYIDLMETNAHNLSTCLNPHGQEAESHERNTQ